MRIPNFSTTALVQISRQWWVAPFSKVGRKGNGLERRKWKKRSEAKETKTEANAAFLVVGKSADQTSS